MLKKKLKPAQQERSKLTVDLIHQATAKVLIKKGYAGTTTNHIALAAGVSIGSFYRYYKNKEEVVHALLAIQIKLGESVLQNSLNQVDLHSLADLCLKAVETTFNFYGDHFELWNVFYNQLPPLKEFRILDEHLTDTAELINAFISEHSKQVQVQNRALAGTVIVQSMVGVFFGSRLDLNQKVNRDALLLEVQDLVTLYLFTER